MLRVDKDKGYIDLSKRRVSPEDIDAIEERFNKSKSVHSIMRCLRVCPCLPACLSVCLPACLPTNSECSGCT